tara:strand:+ start:750 stop:1145 length:396 start_codon:yes stop_codon:yes gene_type:complete
MIKPEAVQAGYTGAILNKIEKSGFRIVSLKKVILSKERAGQFYEVHRERPFYGELVEYMSSGPIIAAILEKDNAVVDFRELIGATDPLEAKEGTIRHEFAESKGKNAVHGSDSNENANIEADFHFSLDERF